MKCAECDKAGLRSTVYEQGGVVMPMGGGQTIWDEDGVRHYHDPDIVSRNYSCSNGHFWGVTRDRSCSVPGCDFGVPAVSSEEPT